MNWPRRVQRKPDLMWRRAPHFTLERAIPVLKAHCWPGRTRSLEPGASKLKRHWGDREGPGDAVKPPPPARPRAPLARLRRHQQLHSLPAACAPGPVGREERSPTLINIGKRLFC